MELELPSGRARYLLAARRVECGHCRTGTRFSSVWASASRQAEVVEWCGHCFNAVCEVLPLDPEHRERLSAVLTALSEGTISRKWSAARPALEDLERRGLL